MLNPLFLNVDGVFNVTSTVFFSCMLQIAMISPGMGCCEHTLNTLRYADRYVCIQHHSTVNT